jgi:hypothetical protein
MRHFLVSVTAVALAFALFGGGQYATANDWLRERPGPGFKRKLLLPPADLRGRQFYLVAKNGAYTPCIPFLMIQGEDLVSGDFSGSYFDPISRQLIPVTGRVSRPLSGVYRIAFSSDGISRMPLRFEGTLVDMSFEVDISGTLRTQTGQSVVDASTLCSPPIH